MKKTSDVLWEGGQKDGVFQSSDRGEGGAAS